MANKPTTPLIVDFKTPTGEIAFMGMALPIEFKSGSVGWNSSAKMELNGKRYQISCNIIEIGSKLSPEELAAKQAAEAAEREEALAVVDE